ncbi:hypothetical protein [Streptomyces cellulosae]|uniref:hypothetical protein n=1 Tax=Streptomyces cellulosae TaxID=1968 RepID=UPI0004CB8C72|nr:hypothetical protein [Streptomyces cellulosae]
MRRATPLALPVLAAALLPAGCGAERAGPPSGPNNARGDGTGGSPQGPGSGPGLHGVRITGLSTPSPGGPSGISAAYEVTNDSTEALTYTIVFDFTTDTGAVLTNTRQTMRDVRPGRTVRRTVGMPHEEALRASRDHWWGSSAVPR